MPLEPLKFTKQKAIAARYASHGNSTEWLNDESLIDDSAVAQIADRLARTSSVEEFQKIMSQIYRELIHKFVVTAKDQLEIADWIVRGRAPFKIVHLYSLMYLVSAHIAKAQEKVTDVKVKNWIIEFLAAINLRRKAFFPDFELTEVNAVQLEVFLDEMSLPYFQDDEKMIPHERINLFAVALIIFLRNKCEILKAKEPSNPQTFFADFEFRKSLREKFRSVDYAVSMLGLLLSYRDADAKHDLARVQKQVLELWGKLEAWCLIPFRPTRSCEELKELVTSSGFLAPAPR